MGIRNGETERTVYTILNRFGQEIWSVVACTLNNNATRLKHSRCGKLVGTRDRHVSVFCVYRG